MRWCCHCRPTRSVGRTVPGCAPTAGCPRVTRSERQLHLEPAQAASVAPLPGPRQPAPATGTARIAVDLLGGDDAPAVVVDGALHACSADPDLRLLLVGPSAVADEVFA